MYCLNSKVTKRKTQGLALVNIFSSWFKMQLLVSCQSPVSQAGAPKKQTPVLMEMSISEYSDSH